MANLVHTPRGEVSESRGCEIIDGQILEEEMHARDIPSEPQSDKCTSAQIKKVSWKNTTIEIHFEAGNDTLTIKSFESAANSFYSAWDQLEASLLKALFPDWAGARLKTCVFVKVNETGCFSFSGMHQDDEFDGCGVTSTVTNVRLELEDFYQKSEVVKSEAADYANGKRQQKSLF